MSNLDTRLALFASGDRQTGGGGSTADRVARDALEGKVGFTIGVVVCNNPLGSVAVYDRFDAINNEYGLRGDNKIDVINISSFTHPGGAQPRGQTLAEAEAICRLLEQRDVGFAALLGYSKILTGEFIDQWGWWPEYGASDLTHHGIYHPHARISNNHPAILPFTADTHGPGAHARAIELFKRGRISYTAMTYHLGAAGVDTGPVFYADPVEIQVEDTADSLSERVHDLELKITAPTIERHLILRTQHLRNAA